MARLLRSLGSTAIVFVSLSLGAASTHSQINFGQPVVAPSQPTYPQTNFAPPNYPQPQQGYPPSGYPPQAYSQGGYPPASAPNRYQAQPQYGQVPVMQPPAETVQAFQAPVVYPSQTAPPQATLSPTSPSDASIFGANPATASGWPLDSSIASPSSDPVYQPRTRFVPVDVYVTEGQTGRFMLGGSVNSDLGVMGNITIEERNFDLFRFPKRPGELFNGAFRGGGQNFRLELVPGNQVQRYTVNWTQPNLFGYSPFSLSVGGFLFDRFYRDWKESRLGGRAMIGYEISPDLSLSTEIRAEDIDINNPANNLNAQLNRVLGSNDLYTGRVSLIHSTRDSPFLPTEGHYLEMIYDQGFGEFDFPRGQVNFSRYFLIRERADGSGRQTLTSAWRLGFTGVDTPVFEHFFAGGFSTMRGFRFRGASPVEDGIQVGGRFQFIGSLEYMFPLTADDMIRAVTFVDYGTIEKDIEFDFKNFRCAPGLGLRIAIPALGPAPLAFDFAFPVLEAAGDQKQVFSFTMGLTR
jgi:outer membrane protein insertion porin family